MQPLLEVEQRLTRKLCGLAAGDSCPVNLVSGSATPRLITVPGHYVDTAGNWIYTPGEMCRRSPKSSYQHVDERNYVEVSQGWVKQLRYGPMVPSDRGYVPLMKLTAKERLWCCSDAMSAHPPNFNVELVEGDSPPAWDTGQPYSIGDGWGGSIPTEIYITVGKGYVQNIRDHAAQEKN